MEETFGFERAIKLIKEGKRVSRLGWNGDNQYVEIGNNVVFTSPDGMPGHCAQSIVFHGTSGTQVGWLASQGDMLAEDWVEVG